MKNDMRKEKENQKNHHSGNQAVEGQSLSPPEFSLTAAPIQASGLKEKVQAIGLPAQVNFVGYTDSELQSFAIMPESGEETYSPKQGKNNRVDGFYQQGKEGWFKVPNAWKVKIEKNDDGSFTPKWSKRGFGRLGIGNNKDKGWVDDDHNTTNPFL